MDPKLKNLLAEKTFWVLLGLSLPGIIATYTAALNGDPIGADALLASPIAIYLGIGRQFARAKSVEAYGHEAAARPLVDDGHEDHEVHRLRDVLPADPDEKAALDALDAAGEAAAEEANNE